MYDIMVTIFNPMKIGIGSQRKFGCQIAFQKCKLVRKKIYNH